MRTETIVRDYYDAWLAGDRDRARGRVHDDLKFRSPADNFDAADPFFETCWKFSEGMDGLEYVQEAFAADSAFVAYRTGDFVCGEFLRLREGRIAEIYVTFSPTV